MPTVLNQLETTDLVKVVNVMEQQVSESNQVGTKQNHLRHIVHVHPDDALYLLLLTPHIYLVRLHLLLFSGVEGVSAQMVRSLGCTNLVGHDGRNSWGAKYEWIQMQFHAMPCPFTGGVKRSHRGNFGPHGTPISLSRTDAKHIRVADKISG